MRPGSRTPQSAKGRPAVRCERTALRLPTQGRLNDYILKETLHGREYADADRQGGGGYDRADRQGNPVL